MKSSTRLLCCTMTLATFALTTSPAGADSADGSADWTGWLGPQRDGQVRGVQVPEPWPEKLQARWQVEVGTGYGSPLIVGDRVFQHGRQGEFEVVWCLDRATGAVRWRNSVRTPFKMGGGGERHGKGPKSCPVYADGRLFTLGISGVLSAWHAQSGERLWHRSYAEHFGKGHPYWGAATSPIVVDKKVVVHLGTDKAGRLVALDTATGEEVWAHGEDGTCYSSPLFLELAGVRQIVEWNHRALVGVDVDTGKTLWESAYPHVGQAQNMPTIVHHRGRILVGGENRGIVAFEPTLAEGTWSVARLWHQEEVALDMSTAIINGEHLYGMSHYDRGRLFCLDPENGEVLWKGPPRTGQNVAFLSMPGYVLALTAHGELRVLRARADDYEVARSYRVSGASTWAPPVLLPEGFLIKDDRTLRLWSLR